MPPVLRLVTFAATFLLVVWSTSTHAAETFFDGFNSGALNGAWAWNPMGASSYSLDGSLNMNVAKGADERVNVDKAPRLTKQQAGDTWTIETRIVSNSGNGNTFAGLTIFKDPNNWLLWGQLRNASLEASGLIGGAWTPAIGTMSTKYTYLRMRRIANRYFFDASSDGTNWTNANVFVDSTGVLTNARVGMLARDWNKGSGTSYVVKFDYFREQDVDAMPSAILGVTGNQSVALETGGGSINQTTNVGVCGTDLGIMLDWQQKTYFVFGDTNNCQAKPTPISNSAAFSSDTTPSDGLTFDGWITDPNGKAKELFGEDKSTQTAIPTGAIAVGDRAYIYYMQVKRWQIGCNLASIASADAANPGSWTKHVDTISWTPANFGQPAVVRSVQDAGTLYVFGIPCGRFGSVKLMKVNESSILTKSAYSYFAGYDAQGAPIWSANESAAVTVAGGPAGELSIRYNAYLGRYIMSYLDEVKAAIVLRESPTPWGPWSAPVQLVTSTQYPQLYGAFMKQGFEENGGETIYYMMSQFNIYNVRLMEATLIKRP